MRKKCVVPEEGRFSHRCLLTEGNSKLIFLGSLRSRKATKAFDLPKLFLRLRTKFHTSDFPMTLAKWFFENSLVDSKGLEFYHRHWEFLRMLGRNPPLLRHTLQAKGLRRWYKLGTSSKPFFPRISFPSNTKSTCRKLLFRVRRTG